MDLISFWNINEVKLRNNYPGVSLNYLQDVFQLSQLSLSCFIEELEKSTPLDYISKTRNFVGYDFFVDPRVLIPRYETELLFEMAFDKIRENRSKSRELFNICEVGVGSGCLGLSLLAELREKKINSNINYLGTDISRDALDVFSINQNKLDLQQGVESIIGDRLYPVIDRKFDLIISNPPYIKTNRDKDQVHKTTLEKEPHIALFIDDNEYDAWFNTLFEQVFHCLNKGAYFMMEGHEDHLQAQAQKQLSSLDYKWSSVEVKKDLTRRDRFLVLQK